MATPPRVTSPAPTDHQLPPSVSSFIQPARTGTRSPSSASAPSAHRFVVLVAAAGVRSKSARQSAVSWNERSLPIPAPAPKPIGATAGWSIVTRLYPAAPSDRYSATCQRRPASTVAALTFRGPLNDRYLPPTPR